MFVRLSNDTNHDSVHKSLHLFNVELWEILGDQITVEQQFELL